MQVLSRDDLIRFAACLLLFCAGALGGCSGRDWEAVRQAAEYPSDFALSVHVERVTTPDDVAERAPLHKPGQYIVQPDRTLRAAMGPGATANYFPGKTRTLTHDQMAALHRLAEAAKVEVLEVSSSPQGSRYRVELTAGGKRSRFVTCPAYGPSSLELADMLRRLRGG